jgi:hypothetical protein
MAVMASALAAFQSECEIPKSDADLNIGPPPLLKTHQAPFAPVLSNNAVSACKKANPMSIS